MDEFSAEDFWKGIVLYGLNNATYKMALGKVLLANARSGSPVIVWDDLASGFLNEYRKRLDSNPMPQQGNPARRTIMERICGGLSSGRLTESEAVQNVAAEAFHDVVPRFQTIGTNREIAGGKFYESDFGKRLVLTDDLMSLGTESFDELDAELEARWSLLEGAFTISQSQHQYQLANSIRDIYLAKGHERKSLTQNIEFLQGYQGNTCFYCGMPLNEDSHVDHVLPRQVINHDEIWNLVLAHNHCNLLKSDYLVGPHFIEKLIARNENIMGSNHPWKHKISASLGKTAAKRGKTLGKHYDNIKTVLGAYYWGGSDGYDPRTDSFYRKFITRLNNPNS